MTGQNEPQTLDYISINSVEWAHQFALSCERELRRTTDERKRARLRNLRDWHYARLTDDQIERDPST